MDMTTDFEVQEMTYALCSDVTGSG